MLADARCEWYRPESRNVKASGYCSGGDAGGGLQPNHEGECVASGGVWSVVPSFGMAPPECIAAPVLRDNHLGNEANGHELMVNITIPPYIAEQDLCVLRVRYNVTPADVRACAALSSGAAPAAHACLPLLGGARASLACPM